MGTRVSQYVHFIIQPTAGKTRVGAVQWHVEPKRRREIGWGQILCWLNEEMTEERIDYLKKWCIALNVLFRSHVVVDSGQFWKFGAVCVGCWKAVRNSQTVHNSWSSLWTCENTTSAALWGLANETTDNKGFIKHPRRLCASSSANRGEVCANLGAKTTPPSSKKCMQDNEASVLMQEKALRYRDVVKHFVCHLLQTQRGRSRRCSGICLWLCFSCLKACVSWSKSCLVRNPSDHPRPVLPLHTAQMSMSEPVLWLKFQVKNGTRFTCVLVCNRTINCLRNWQRLAIVSTLEVTAWNTTWWFKLETISVCPCDLAANPKELMAWVNYH